MAKQNPLENYITVAERIEAFYAKYPEGRINTVVLEHDVERGFILMKAMAYSNRDDAEPMATGHAYELRDGGFVQKTSYIEVCETSAVGRAIALAGFEVKRGIATREDMERMEERGQYSPTPPKPEPVKHSLTDPIQEGQKRALTNIAKNHAVDIVGLCQSVFGKHLDNLTAGDAAKLLIDIQKPDWRKANGISA